MKNHQFLLDGKPFAHQMVPASVIRVREFLAKQKIGNLFTSHQVCDQVGIQPRTLQRHIQIHPDLRPYRAILRYPKRQIIWGSAKTIAELRKHKELTT